ncbi:PstS family phosphate ABC transporter substrate-binding protein [Anabaena cylindrica FACHB-243]|uniref:Phosphate-binding protein n=1 Tax=Anabaena cylindrica (strain ATCC 27899 / PCC 7122) TaxID=272123 RepID=K9ZPV6_ANACC|nr:MULTISPECIES: PstS family phosphate ABC transporter substrate-binding protein [Anabaena]AFZ60385.1 phosphate ABC transporter substrate-binding protein, PhoT family [Anabaena cylindrica PCC 7122]MBD2416373.1 PstS family phosphate ABC transporter substrate-binding protein [Anabaena cylindrica FACHB-243]MCM2408426.1 PstS family phosphate ABC transporter substrate-binding protein [Anabaena sp. CCAP 1446/1C]BAY02540.1 phosphate binding protein [Anabaena cylindrica PCC 7122]
MSVKTTRNKLVLAVGMLTLATSCTTAPDSSIQTQQTAKTTQVTDSETIKAIKIDGSSTVHPITQAIAKEFPVTTKNNTPVQVSISGTGGGFEKFCTGKIDINNASRPISKAEMAVCNKNDVRYIELPIAFDALTIAVNPQNDWAKDITVAELKKMWEPAAEGKITRWNQVRSSWPDRPLNLYGAGKQSGTFDYFTEALVGKAKSSRNDYIGSEDDDVLVEGINKDPNALGYFGYAYYEKNKDKLKVVAVNNGKGAVLPSPETVEKSQYQPLSRPLFIYVNLWSSQNRGDVYKFVDFYLQKASTVANSVGYVPLPEEAYKINYVQLHNGKAGTVFAGKAELDLTIGQLLRKQKEF